MKVLYIGTHIDSVKWNTKNYDVSVISCGNALKAIHVLTTQNDIEAIICDYNVTGNNGIYLYNKLKGKENLSVLPFILLVEEHNIKVYREAFDSGIDDYFVINTTSPEQILQRAQQLISLHKDSIFGSPVKQPIKYKFPLSKRIFDVVVASTILLLLSPLLLLTVIAIRLESKGKVYYIAKRVGRKTFDFYKLRSMRNGADKLLKELAEKKNQYNNKEVTSTIEMSVKCPRCSILPTEEYCSPLNYEGIEKICDYMYHKQKQSIQKNKSSFIKIVDDPRITKIGKIIRNTSIDELPQLINVIKGDMSLVGNRPLPVYEAELLTQDQMSKRFLAPAGITGLWQVELRGKGGDMSEEERIALDNKYADYFADNSYSLWHDIKILLRTVPALFQRSTV